MTKKIRHLLNEDEVKKMLGIEDWRNLSKKKTVEFISALPNIDPEVAAKIIGQIPNLVQMAIDLAKEQRESFQEALKANDKSSQATIDALSAMIDLLSQELNKENLTTEERMAILDTLNNLAGHLRGIHKDNQKLILKSLSIVAASIAAGALGVAAVLGTNGRISLPDFSEDE